jgi:hypothetical protein
MIAGLRTLQAGVRFELDIIDVDTDPALESRYGERVPVLVCTEGELCHYHLATAKVDDYLNSH